MNTSGNTRIPTSEQVPADEAPPVLARVPWLSHPATEAALPMPHAEPTPAFDPSCLETHSVLAVSGLAVTTADADPICLRIDPPQSKPTVDAVVEPSHRATTRSGADESLAPLLTPLLPEPAAAERTTTFLRFDPPAHSAVEPVAPAHVDRTSSTSAWHQWVAAIDNVIRQYQKVIMLAALLTAAGLMMLVVESQQPTGEPTSDHVSPVASDAASQPPPAPLADLGSQPSTDANAEQRLANATNTARGPQSDMRTRSVAVQDCETKLVPFAPDSEADVAHDSLVLPEVSEDWAAAASDPCEPDAIVGYPDTHAPECEIPRISMRPSQESRPPSVAQFSGHLQSVSPQATK